MEATRKIQRWFKRLNKTLQITKRIESFNVVQCILRDLDRTTSVEKAKLMLCEPEFVTNFTQLAKLLNCFHIACKSKQLQSYRLLSSAVMIAKFSEDMLFTDSYMRNSLEAINCRASAYNVLKYLERIMDCRHNSTKSNISEQYGKLLRYSIAIHDFFHCFEKWREVDAIRLAQNMEESFAQAYAIYLASKESMLKMNGNNEIDIAELLTPSIDQLEKIKQAMIALRGTNNEWVVVTRLEEICASVEASFLQHRQLADSESDNEATPQSTIDEKVDYISSDTKAIMKLSSTQVTSQGRLNFGGADSGEVERRTWLYLNKIIAHSNSSNAVNIITNPEQLVYEITLHPDYRLLPALPTSSSSLLSSEGVVTDDGSTLISSFSLSQQIKEQILRVMGDNLIQSLRRCCTVCSNPAELKIGMIVAVSEESYVTSTTVDAALSSSASSTTSNACTAARIINIHTDDSFIDVEYINNNKDGKQEKISMNRLIYSDSCYNNSNCSSDNSAPLSDIIVAAADPVPFILALQGLAQQIASFTPNRPDIHKELFSAIDTPLLSQMILNNAMHPLSDLLPILQFFQRSLMSLQAPSRVAGTTLWMKQLEESFHTRTPNPDTTITTTTRRHLLYEVAPLLPSYFERANIIMEEIHLDLANYYISLLSPILTTRTTDVNNNSSTINSNSSDQDDSSRHNSVNATTSAAAASRRLGHVYLYKLFQQRLAATATADGQNSNSSSSLHVTASLLYALLKPINPTNNSTNAAHLSLSSSSSASTSLASLNCWENTVKDIMDAGVTFYDNDDNSSGTGQQQRNQREISYNDLLNSLQYDPSLPTDTTSGNILSSPLVESQSSMKVSQQQQQYLSSDNRSNNKCLSIAIMARALISLLQLPVRLDSVQAAATNSDIHNNSTATAAATNQDSHLRSGIPHRSILPETLLYDASRLAALRDIVDRIALESSIVIATRQVMNKYKLPQWTIATTTALFDASNANKNTTATTTISVEEDFQYRLDVLLRQRDASLPSLTAEVVRYIQAAIDRYNTNISFHNNTANSRSSYSAQDIHLTANSELLQQTVSQTLKDVIVADNPVLTLFSKRVYKILLRALIGHPYKQLLQSYSLHSRAQQRNITTLLDDACKLFRHNMNAYGDIYQSILSHTCKSLMS